MKRIVVVAIAAATVLMVALVASLASAAPSALEAPVLYATGVGTGAGAGLSALYTVDPITGTASLVWNFPSIHIYAGGLAYDVAADTLYATGVLDSDTGTSRLFTINRFTGATTAFGGLSAGINLSSGGLAINPLTGVMYATGTNGFQSTGLFTIDKNTGAATLVGQAGGSCCAGDFGIMLNGLGFRSDGTLFANGWALGGPSYPDPSTSHLYTVNLATGDATHIGPSGVTLGRSLKYSGLAFRDDGTLLSLGSLDAASGTLYSVNTANGAATSLNSGTGYGTGPIHFGVDGGLAIVQAAPAPTPTPVPPTPTPTPIPGLTVWGLGALALVLAAAMVWRVARRRQVSPT